MRTKHIYTALCILIMMTFSSDLYSQQRIILLEEYTGRGCGPCGRYNPDFDRLVHPNLPNKVVLLKYEEYSYPPHILCTDDGKARASYYGFQAAPHLKVDGNYESIHIGSFSQNIIDTRSAMPSPFNVSINYDYNYTFDSITVNMTVTAIQDFNTSGALYARIALAERVIHYLNTITPNGEQEFHHVFRKMLPNTLGYSLPASWTKGQQQQIKVTALLPSNIFNLGDLEVVAFVQDDSTKEVLQAAYNEPKIFANDAGIDTIKNIPAFQCNLNPFTPVVSLKNYGTAPLTTASLLYKYDNGSFQTQSWTGNLASGQSTEISLPIYNPSGALHILVVYASDPNGETDRNIYNDSAIYKFSITNSFNSGPFYEEFDQLTSHPYKVIAPYFYVDDVDLDQVSFVSYNNSTYGSSFGVGEGALMINYFRQVNPYDINEDHLYVPPMTLDGSETTYFIFDHAYALCYENDSDVTVKIQLSKDCGLTWNTIFNKKGNKLFTAPPENRFTPDETEWKHNEIELSDYMGESVLLRFATTSIPARYMGNMLFLDKIGFKLSSSEKENNNTKNNITIYPNPAEEIVHANIKLTVACETDLRIYNTLGKLVYSDKALLGEGNNLFSIPCSSWAGGIYYLKFSTSNFHITRQLIVKK